MSEVKDESHLGQTLTHSTRTRAHTQTALRRVRNGAELRVQRPIEKCLPNIECNAFAYVNIDGIGRNQRCRFT